MEEIVRKNNRLKGHIKDPSKLIDLINKRDKQLCWNI